MIFTTLTVGTYFAYLFRLSILIVNFLCHGNSTVHACWPHRHETQHWFVLRPHLRICRLHAPRCYSPPPPPTPQHHYNKVWQLSATLYIKLPATRFSLLMLSLNHLSVTPIQCCQVSLLTSTATTVTTNVPYVTPTLLSSSTTRSVQVLSFKECHADPILSSSITSSIQTPSVTPILLSSSSALQIQAPIVSVTPFILSSCSTPSRKNPSVLRSADSTVQF